MEVILSPSPSVLLPVAQHYTPPIFDAGARQVTGGGYKSSSVELETASHLWATCHKHSASWHYMERVTTTHCITFSGTFGHSNRNELYRRDANTSFPFFRQSYNTQQTRSDLTLSEYLCIPKTVLLGNQCLYGPHVLVSPLRSVVGCLHSPRQAASCYTSEKKAGNPRIKVDLPPIFLCTSVYGLGIWNDRRISTSCRTFEALNLLYLAS